MITVDRIEHLGWKNCIRISNGLIEVIATTDVGPRIIHAGLVGERNLFWVSSNDTGKGAGEKFRLYGGHRLWHAPEDPKRTYVPDNNEVAVTTTDSGVILEAPIEASTGIGKKLEVSLDSKDAIVRVTHTLTNHHLWSVRLAPWAITMMAPEGLCIAPMHEVRPHTESLLPARSVVLWHYTRMNDPRLEWGDQFVLLKQNPEIRSPIKFGMQVGQGWAGYCVDGFAFIKSFATNQAAEYPDDGCNFETFANHQFLEVESLGPLTDLPPGDSVTHVEHWLIDRLSNNPDQATVAQEVQTLAKRLFGYG